MSEGDLLADRKRLKRSLSNWRVIALVVLFGAAALLLNSELGGSKGKMPGRNYIAQVTIDGILTTDEKREELLKEIAEDKNAVALLVRLDSPGGTTVGGEELYLQLQKISKKKPVVGVMRTLCASACYMASLGTNHVIAREGTLTGSIGVLLQAAEFSELAKKLGINPITVKSGKYKDVPSFTDPFSESDRAVVQEVVMDAYDQFVTLIANRRGMTKEEVIPLADGRVYTGRQALPLDLIDGIGGEDEAKAWLKEKAGIPLDTEVKPMDEEPEFESLFARLSQWTGIEIFGRSAITLDGLISIWQHPAL